ARAADDPAPAPTGCVAVHHRRCAQHRGLPHAAGHALAPGDDRQGDPRRGLPRPRRRPRLARRAGKARAGVEACFMPSSLARRAALATRVVLAAAAPLSALGATRTTAPAAFKHYVVSNGANGPASGGEPSLGYDPKRDAVVFGASKHETRMVFRDT